MQNGVFISYRRTDAKWAKLLADELSRKGVAVWYDGMINPGQDWRDEIVENIKLAKLILVLFSSDVNTSTELKKELAVADQANSIIIVVRIENVAPQGGYAYELSDRNWYDAFHNPEKELVEVAAYIAGVLRQPDDLERHFRLSVAELERRRRRRLLGRVGLARNNTFLALVFGASSAAGFFAYNASVDAIGNLVAGGNSPLVAVLYAALATSIGSPLLLLSAVRQGFSIATTAIAAFAAVNCIVLLLWARNLVSWMRMRQP